MASHNTIRISANIISLVISFFPSHTKKKLQELENAQDVTVNSGKDAGVSFLPRIKL